MRTRSASAGELSIQGVQASLGASSPHVFSATALPSRSVVDDFPCLQVGGTPSPSGLWTPGHTKRSRAGRAFFDPHFGSRKDNTGLVASSCRSPEAKRELQFGSPESKIDLASSASSLPMLSSALSSSLRSGMDASNATRPRSAKRVSFAEEVSTDGLEMDTLAQDADSKEFLDLENPATYVQPTETVFLDGVPQGEKDASWKDAVEQKAPSNDAWGSSVGVGSAEPVVTEKRSKGGSGSKVKPQRERGSLGKVPKVHIEYQPAAARKQSPSRFRGSRLRSLCKMTQSATAKRIGLLGADIPAKDGKLNQSLPKRMSLIASPSDLKKADIRRKASTQHPRTVGARESVKDTLKAIRETEAQLVDLTRQLGNVNCLTDNASAFIQGISLKSSHP